MSDHDDKAKWMRAVCATEAEWGPDGALRRLVLGPAATVSDSEDPAKQLSPLERERQERQRRRDLVARSSGGPVRRLDVDS